MSEITECGLSKRDELEYRELQTRLTSRNPDEDYDIITRRMLGLIYLSTMSKVVNLDLKEKYTEVKRQIDDIFIQHGRIDGEVFEPGLIDEDYIILINIILLQCILVFTILCCSKKEINRPIAAGTEFNELISIDWINYRTLKYTLSRNKLHLISKLYYGDRRNKIINNHLNSPDIPIYLITLMSHINLSETVRSFLNLVFYCGYTSDLKFADSFESSPFEFLLHDIVHGTKYMDFCIKRNEYSYIINESLFSEEFYENMMDEIDLNLLKLFYNYCISKFNIHTEDTKQKLKNKRSLHKIEIIIYFMLHEASCRAIDHTIILSSVERFLDYTDLGGIVPKKCFINDEEFNCGNEENTKLYIEDCISLFEEVQAEWSVTLSGGKKKSKRKSKRNKRKSKRNKIKLI